MKLGMAQGKDEGLTMTIMIFMYKDKIWRVRYDKNLLSQKDKIAGECNIYQILK